MEKILITGAAGFIGSHLTEMCVMKGYDVKVFIRYNSKNNWGWLENSEIKNEIEVITGDIRDYDSVYKALKNCQTVFHLAALIGIPYSYISPLAYIKTNVEGTYNILEASKQRGIENVLITSTSETYGTAQYVPIDEKHPLVGQSPYSASKVAADQLAISYYRSFKLPIKIVRPFNTFGPRQSARAIIPTILSQILSGKTKIKLGNLHPTRDLTFVRDTTNGFIAIANSDKLFGDVVNIGMNDEHSVSQIVKTISKILNINIEIDTDNSRIRPKMSEVDRLICDNKKLISTTGWRPKYTFREGTEETIEWFKRNLEFYKPDIYTV